MHIKDGAVVDDDADHARFFEGDIRNLAVIYFHDAVEGRGVVGNEFHIRDEAVIGLHIIAGEGIVEEERLFVDTEAFALCDIARIDIGDVFHDRLDVGKGVDDFSGSERVVEGFFHPRFSFEELNARGAYAQVELRDEGGEGAFEGEGTVARLAFAALGEIFEGKRMLGGEGGDGARRFCFLDESEPDQFRENFVHDAALPGDFPDEAARALLPFGEEEFVEGRLLI